MSAVISAQWLAMQRAVIGSVLIEPKTADAVLAQTRVEDYTDVYRDIFLIVQELVQSGTPIDAVVILNRMSNQDGSARKLLADLIDETPTSAHYQEYINALLEQAQLHRVRSLAMELADCTAVDEAAALAARLSEVTAVRETRAVHDMRALLDRFYERHSKTDPVKYLPWGQKKLDALLYAELGDFVVLGGYPSDGKTALALSFAWAQAETLKVGFFSLETRSDKLFDRQVSMLTGIPMARIKRNRLSDDDWKAMAAEARTIYDRSLEIIPAAGMTAVEVMQYAMARRYQVIYIDYVQLLRSDNPRAPRYEAVTQISTTLHTLANQFGIAVVGLSQLRRPDRQNRAAPNMSDLRESGQLEQDADVILLLYRTAPNNPEITDRDLKIAKNKEGSAREIIPLDFDGNTQRFRIRRPSGSLREQVEAAGRELEYEAAQFSMLEGRDDELPFL